MPQVWRPKNSSEDYIRKFLDAFGFTFFSMVQSENMSNIIYINIRDRRIRKNSQLIFEIKELLDYKFFLNKLLDAAINASKPLRKKQRGLENESSIRIRF